MKSKFRFTFWNTFFIIMMLLFAVALFRRYFFGLGAISNLNDEMPWGLWIGFDLLCGVALAAGGFTVTGVVHIFHLEEFKPIVRSTVLTAFLGYLMVIFALLIDVGRPWNLWRPFFTGMNIRLCGKLAYALQPTQRCSFLSFCHLFLKGLGLKRFSTSPIGLHPLL